MLLRSLGFCPVIVSIRIYIPMPSGYCGATRPMCQSGDTYATPSRRAAAARVIRILGVISLILKPTLVGGDRGSRCVPRQLDVRTLRRHPHIALHLLMQRRTKVGAVEREHADAFRGPDQRAG